MWNWLVGALSSGATILLFDGFPMYKKDDLLFEYISEEKATLFGVSAKYIDTLNNSETIPKNKHDLSNLRTICSTGSPLSKDGFRYIYKKIKEDIHLSSISGGTDIVSCFVLGNLFQPVYEGEIQNKGLGMDVDIFNENGLSIQNKKRDHYFLHQNGFVILYYVEVKHHRFHGKYIWVYPLYHLNKV